MSAAGLGIFCYGGLKEYAAGELGLMYQEELITREQMDAWWEKADAEEKMYIKDMTLWKSRDQVKVENLALGQTAKARMTEAAGNMNQVMPGKLCGGSLVSSGDETGCVISRELAHKLNLDGHKGSLRILGKEYEVRGILDSREAVCMIQGEKNTLYSRIQISYEKMPASRALQMLAGFLPKEADIKAEGDLYRGAGGLFFMMPFWALFAIFAAWLRRLYHKDRWKAWVREVCSICYPVVVLAGICILMLLSFHFSDDYIPGAWSDFSFFSNLAAEKAGDMQRLLAAALDYRDRQMLLWTVGCMVSGGVSIGIIFNRKIFRTE